MKNKSLNLALCRLTGIGLALVAVCSQAATLVVTSNNDSGAGSLRQAIADASTNGTDTITFDAALNGSVITLTSGQLLINNKHLSIQGPGPSLLAINGNATSRVFKIYNSVANSRWYVTLSGLSITNGFASQGTPEGKGGGGFKIWGDAYNYYLNVTISNCIVRANQSTVSDYDGGGGICTGLGVGLKLIDSEIIDNTAAGGGGAGLWSRTGADISRCTFVGNKTSAGGGAMAFRGGPISIANCTISGNSVTTGNGVGGGIQIIENATWNIYNSTITSNSIVGDKSGGGIASVNFNNNSTVPLTNSLYSTIVAGNTSKSGVGPDLWNSIISVANCLIQVTNGVSIFGTNNIFGQAALLEPLANNGGLTRTHALKRKSPALDHGYNPLNLVTDQRGTGFPRLLGAAVDIGSYEFVPLPGATLITIR